jgi:hypothetical protein|tara:strand:- start:531 stop:692 length:162 start_codon:yes stop_codon:yes gene_type:complete
MLNWFTQKIGTWDPARESEDDLERGKGALEAKACVKVMIGSIGSVGVKAHPGG